ncbi:siderophore-interacting protein (plasmid) [Photobacterium sp. GJ3]|uniref:siderophore-interacting protein n=1 Tax=Photobacterium sp. GJ3 TaxID=2829502 RepID=UPI001B8D6ECF|nr:siderophore-interacting protein [Photobacterium sp. GJ3]QUJ69779.1 siderophore-interacting protein [Photobacterium sp. GJ3]
MQKRLQPKTFTVQQTFNLSPAMRRIVLTGEAVRQLPADSAGQYVKLLFTPDGSTDLSGLADDQRPVLRTYTISEFDAGNGTLAIDFVKHHHAGEVNPETGGYASHWAMHASVGDTISLGGPNTIQGLSDGCDWVLLIGDMTALPSIQLKLARFAADARGYVVLDLHSNADLPDLKLPAGITLIVRTSESTASLSERVSALTWLSGTPAIWCACEFSQMRAIRQHLNQQPDFDRKTCYISSYWKEGVTEDGHKVLKRDDQESYAG